MNATSAYFRHRGRGYKLIAAVMAVAMVAVGLIAALPSQAQAATATSFADDTTGVYLYSAGVDSSGTPTVGPRTTFECTGEPGTDPTNTIIEAAINAGELFFIGDTANEVVTFTPGSDGETDANSAPDPDVPAINVGLTAIDDYGFIGNTGDDASNWDAGTGGTITLQLDANDDATIDLVVPDGQIATGVLSDDGSTPSIDNSEIFIFEDAATSGMSILLEGDGTPVTINIDDYQRNPDVPGEADDTLIAIDLDSLAGFDGTFVSSITITDDGIPTAPPGRNDCDSSQTPSSIDSSLEIDAVATRTDTIIGPISAIDIEKSTNGVQSDTGPGEVIPAGSDVTWEYVVTNSGTAAIIDAVVVDDQGEAVICPSGTANIPLIAPGEVVICTATGVAIEGPYVNGSTVSGQPVDLNGAPFGDPVSDADPSAYTGEPVFVPAPAVDIEKTTNGEQADVAGEGPTLTEGDAVTWTYTVTNTGNTTLINVTVSDSDAAVVVGCGATANVIASLGIGESVECTATGTATVGDYRNNSTASGEPVDDQGNVLGDPVTDEDPSGYIGQAPPVASLGDFVWFDANADGIQDADEAPVADVVVNLWSVAADGSADAIISSTQTGTDGLYGFGDLVAGDYIVQFVAPDGQEFTVATAGTDAALDSNPDPATGITAAVTLAAGDNNPTIDAGLIDSFVPAPSVDIEKLTNGVQSDEAPGAELEVGSEVTWTYIVTNDGNMDMINVAVTDDQVDDIVCPGADAATPNVIPALAVDAEVTCSATGVAIEGGYTNTATASGQPINPDGTPFGDPITDTDPSNYTGVVGFVPAPSVDIEKLTNGVQSDEAPGAELEVGSEVTWTYIVTNDGNMDMINVAVTDDQVDDIVCPGADAATPNVIPALAVDAEVTCSATGVAIEGGYTNTATASGQPINPDGTPFGDPITDTDPSNYTGVVGFVPAPSVDIEKLTNGVQSDEAPGAEITVGSEVTWTYIVTNDGNVALAGVAVTDDQVDDIVCPGADAATPNVIPALAVDAEVTCSATGVATEGAYTNTADATGTPVDENGDPIPGLDPVSDTDPSNYTGVPAPVELASLGDYVWLDTNRDGIQDADETGVAGVVVELFVSEDGEPADEAAATFTTEADGAYGFDELDPAVNYFVQFTAPDDHVLTIAGAGDDTDADSNPDPATGLTAEIDLAPGQNDPSIDAGVVVELASLGNFVWFDANSNGIQDTDEEGIAGVTVNLVAANADGSPGDELDSTETDEDGFYGFTGLDPAVNYLIQVIAGEDRIVTVAGAGDDETVDSDIDDETGFTAAVDLAPGENNLTLDAGVRPGPVRIGDTVFFDENSNGLQDADEPGIADSTVELREADADGTPGAVIQTTTTTDTGKYEFLVDPGTYFVQFDAGDPFSFTTQDVGDDETVDSDVDPGTGLTTLITVVTGQDDPTIDAGVLPLNAEVSIEKTTNGNDADVTGPVLTAGETVTWVYTVVNTGNVDLANVVVDDDVEGRICVIASLTVGQNTSCSKTGTARAGIYVNNGSAAGDPVDEDGNPAQNPDGSPVERPTSNDPSRYEGTQVLPTRVIPTSTPVPAAPTATPVPPTPTPIVIVVTPTPVPPPLAVTGASSSDLALVAGGLVLMGGLLLISARRRSSVEAE